MNIGSAIKIIRKQKKISQKELSEKCNISINALCQIELNNSFPQKTTIHKICDVMNIPPSYLLFFSITDEDIPEEKRFVFNTLSKTIQELLIEDIS